MAARNRKTEVTTEQRNAANAAQAALRRFQQRKAWFVMEMHRQQINRYQMAMDEDYYDSIQWTPDEAAEVRRRGQNPVVYNEIKPTCDFLIGTERRMRRDFKVLARNSSAKEAADDADVKTKLLKYLDDVNRTKFERSQVFDDKIKAGVGWLELGIRADPTDEPIYARHESWRNMLHDSLGTRLDLEDSRYLFRFKEIDLDVALAYFPDKAEELERAAMADEHSMFQSSWLGGYPTQGVMDTADMPAKWLSFDAESWINNPRRRVLLIECWNKEPTRKTTGQGPGTYDKVEMRMHVSIMTEFDTILEAESPYKHNKYPFVPDWCYRRKRDRAPYGVIRAIRGPQDDLNKRMSKSLFHLSMNQIRVEKSAVDKNVMTQEDIQEKMSDPSALIAFADGALSGGKVQVREGMDFAQGHLAIAEIDRQSIRGTSSVNEENRGMKSSATSRVAMDAKADRGSVGTAAVFDNSMLAHQMEGDIEISLIEQFYTEQKTFAVTGERYKLDYTTINQQQPDGTKLNDVTRHAASFVIGEVPWRQHLGEAAFESAMSMLGQLAPVAPAVVTSIIDLVFEWSDLPNKQTILQRIRQATGMSDPDAEDTPEQQQEKQKKAQLAELQFNLQLAGLRADIAEKQAKGEKVSAEAIAKRLEALYMAAQGAQVLRQVPGAMPIADELLRSAGFEDRATQQVLPADAMEGQPALPGPQDQQQLPELQQTDGARTGIETPAPDGVIPEGV